MDKSLKAPNSSSYKNGDDIFTELIKYQKKNIQPDRKLSCSDIKRISKKLNKSIFDDTCSLWKGAVTSAVGNKNIYINFFYCGKKYALHRLLYLNYIGDLNENEYVKFKCKNKGSCCNINHIYKLAEYKKGVKIEKSEKIDEINKPEKIEEPVEKVIEPTIKKSIIVGFN